MAKSNILSAALSALLLSAALPQGAAAQPPLDFSVKKEGGDPLKGLPPGSRIVSSFGERPVFSPDGNRIAFIGRTLGDAFELDLRTGAVRNLTAHAPHNGFYRVQYLPDGSFILTGLRQPERISGDDPRRSIARDRQIATELFFLDKDATGRIFPLNAHILEGFATSRIANRIAWVEDDPKLPAEDYKPDSKVTGTLRVADVVVQDGAPRLANIREVTKVDVLDQCMIEAQDFRDNDAEVVGPCYLLDRDAFPVTAQSRTRVQRGERMVGVSVATGAMKTYFETTSFYAELEGVSHDGKWALVECGERGRSLDICRVNLERPKAGTLERITFGQDYGPVRFANPTVSPDGKWAAFHISSVGRESGTGTGFAVIPLPPPPR